jgi:glycosyltransferase involved in cell wall biosynthesis
MQNSPTLTIIVPAYNEAESLVTLLPDWIAFCKSRNMKLVVVDDGSKDATKLILKEYYSEEVLTVVHNKVNKGYGGAIKEGIKMTNTPYVITMDADGQHYLEDITCLLEHLQQTDADMVVGQREQNAGTYRLVGKWLIRKVAKQLMHVPIKDLNSGMKLYRTDLAKKYVALCPDSMAFSDTIALVFLSQKHLVNEIPIKIRQRQSGKSTISTKTAFETLIQILNIVILFNPMRVFIPLSIASLVVSLAWGIPIVLRGNGVSVGAMLGIITSIFFFFAGLLAEQLSMIRKSSI